MPRAPRFQPCTPCDIRDAFELGPGSAVYLPRGLIHPTRSTGPGVAAGHPRPHRLHGGPSLAESAHRAHAPEAIAAPEPAPRLHPRGLPAAEQERLFADELPFFRSLTTSLCLFDSPLEIVCGNRARGRVKSWKEDLA